MSAKPTLVVHSRRTDEADGNGNTGARTNDLQRERTASAGEGPNDAACEIADDPSCEGTGDHSSGEIAVGDSSTRTRPRTRIDDNEAKEQLCHRNGNGPGIEKPGN
jgi:hypothetical protein